MRIALRSKLTLWMLVLAIVPLAIATVEIVRRNTEPIELGAKEYRLAVADSVVRSVRELVSRATAELRAVGGVVGQATAPSDFRRMAAKGLVIGAKYVHEVAVYAKNGELAEVYRAEGHAPCKSRPTKLDEGVRGVAQTEKAATLGVVFPEGGGPPALPIVVPVYREDNAELYAFLWAQVDLAPLSQDVGGLSHDRFDKEVDRVFVIDDALRVIAHASPERLGQTVEGDGAVSGIRPGDNSLRRDVARSGEYERTGVQLIGAIVPVPELGWGVVVEQLRSRAYAAVRTVWTTAAVVGSGFALLAIIVGLVVGHRLSAPIVAVSRAAGEVAAGAFDTRVAVRSKDEVGEMATAFNKMAADLGNFERQVVEQTRIRTNLSRYLSPDVVDRVVASDSEIQLGGERREVTVIFADIVSFTPLAEGHDPERLVGIMNELYTFLTEIVFRHGGIIDKFLGDCVMAVFGAPYGQEDDAVRAVRAAEEMMSWLDVGNAKWEGELGRRLELAIGINTGQAIAGNIGSQKRMEYTVIGTTVNTAARLESIALGGQILMSRETASRVEDEFDCVSLGMRKLSGMREEVELFALED